LKLFLKTICRVDVMIVIHNIENNTNRKKNWRDIIKTKKNNKIWTEQF